MKAVAAKLTRGLNIGSIVIAADNSGAKIVKITGVKGGKSKKGRQVPCKIGDRVKISVKKGQKDMRGRGKLFDAVVVRQKKPYRRKTGERICFSDNAAVLLKDEKGNPKGTQIKGPIAREIADRWPNISKLAQIIV